MKTLLITAALALGLAPLCACGDNKDETRDKKDDLGDRARSLGERAKDLGARTKDEAAKLGDRAKDEARELGDRARGGADDAVRAVEPYVDKAKGGIEAAIVGGKQVAGKAESMRDSVLPVLEDGELFKPIYQRIDDAEARAALDAEIAAMAHTEVIDGVTIGYRAHSKRQYLVIWRRDDYLVGFVYTSLTDIAIEQVIKRVPKLIALIDQAI